MSSDEEHDYSEEEEAPADEGPSEAEKAMEKRRQQATAGAKGLNEDELALLEDNRKEREAMSAEINEMKARSKQRKKEREEEERVMAEKRSQEEAERRAVEEEKRAKKDEEERIKREKRESRMAEFAKMAQQAGKGGRNFVIESDGTRNIPQSEGDDEEPQEEKKSKEQLEAEKRAILEQRIKPLDISGAGADKLKDTAKNLHREIFRLESEKYDMEKRYKEQQYDMQELAERARSINKVGKGGLKRIQVKEDEHDRIGEMIPGAPAKIVMFSQFERQKDKRPYSAKQDVFTGATWLFPAEKIRPERIVKWNEDTGLPEYEEVEGAAGEAEAPAE